MKQKLKRLLSSFSIYSEMSLKIWHNGTILDLKRVLSWEIFVLDNPVCFISISTVDTSDFLLKSLF